MDIPPLEDAPGRVSPEADSAISAKRASLDNVDDRPLPLISVAELQGACLLTCSLHFTVIFTVGQIKYRIPQFLHALKSDPIHFYFCI